MPCCFFSSLLFFLWRYTGQDGKKRKWEGQESTSPWRKRGSCLFPGCGLKTERERPRDKIDFSHCCCMSVIYGCCQIAVSLSQVVRYSAFVSDKRPEKIPQQQFNTRVQILFVDGCFVDMFLDLKPSKSHHPVFYPLRLVGCCWLLRIYCTLSKLENPKSCPVEQSVKNVQSRFNILYLFSKEMHHIKY